MPNIPTTLLQPKQFLKYKKGLIIGIVGVAVTLILFFYMSEIPTALSLLNEFLKEWSGLVLGVIGTVISLIVFFYNRKRDQFNSLFEVFKHREGQERTIFGFVL